MPFSIPEPLKLEHGGLHQKVLRATHVDGPVGEAEKSVAKILHRSYPI
jgi:hypothetical protein